MKKFLLAASVFAISTAYCADSPEEKALNSLTHLKMTPAERQQLLEEARAITKLCSKDSERRACIEFFWYSRSFGLPLSNPEAALAYWEAFKEIRNS